MLILFTWHKEMRARERAIALLCVESSYVRLTGFIQFGQIPRFRRSSSATL